MKVFPDFAPLLHLDKEAVDPYIQREQPVISEMTFANMYIWHKTEPVEVSFLGKSLVFRSRSKGDIIYSPPVGSDDKVEIIRKLIDHSLKSGSSFLLRGVVEPLTSRLTREGYEPVPDRDNWDYVYLSAELANLQGPRFYSKRKELNKFVSKYERSEYVKITASIIPDCERFQDEWCQVKNCIGSRSLSEENDAVHKAFESFDRLRLSGGAVLIEGMVQAFTIGEPLNRQVWVTHFEKACPSIPGLYQYINQKLAASVCQSYKLINREQDLGYKGLRAAKQSYNPHHFVEKSFLRVDA